jgi:N-acetylglutamate synthase-like GNAT family acetyltransferase
MMEIRPATKNDIPAIIKLLKASLGESLMPKSEAYWQWKHINNPFGASPVWIATEADQIIGVIYEMELAGRRCDLQCY